ncbi:MAG: TrkA family potassium uptake protein [Candidatus Woesearchaeota archaeon]
MKRQIAVIGMGRFGSTVAKTLSQLGENVIAIDEDEKKINAIKDFVAYAKQANATDIVALRQAGVANCETAVVATGDASSIIITMALLELGVKNVIAKASDEIMGAALKKVGASRVIYPEIDSAVRLANQLISSDILEFIEISPEYSVQEIIAPRQFVNWNIGEMEFRKKYDVTIIGIKRKNKIIVVPASNEVIEKDDVLVLLGKTESIKRLINDMNGK